MFESKDGIPECIAERGYSGFGLVLRGARYPSAQNLPSELEHGTIYLSERLRGGKGGFGSRLKAEGQRLSSKRRSGNQEFSRDLQGRRIGDLLDAKMIEEYLQREPELRAKAEAERLKNLEKKIELLERVPKFKDQEYLDQKQKSTEEIERATKKNFQKLLLKRKTNF